MAVAAEAVRTQLQAAMKVACADGIIIAMPALPGPPPRRDASPQELARFEDGALQLASIAALSGVPQVCVPLMPCGLSPGQSVTAHSRVEGTVRCERHIQDRATLRASWMGSQVTGKPCGAGCCTCWRCCR